ncbi:LAFE_0F04962g1_1 [Lachancea fermentati]|uniref:Conserved oligomeric Golgi complex subunit 2 n=1 Tax=Lachancea fermentati TaxID=4955 RepID=A0A1G4MF09_LACFM|nr:LAFE_0F04962g1_1 [Lachancea fermentati]
MDVLDENWDFPLTKDVSRDLFSSYTDEECFDVDTFLLENKFQFVPLDSLTKELHTLTGKMDQALLEEMQDSYTDYMELCASYSEENDTKHELQLVQQDLIKFRAELKALTDENMATTKEVIIDTLEYLDGLNNLSRLLNDHTILHKSLGLAEELCHGLQTLCEDEEELESLLCCDLIKQLHTLIQQIYIALSRVGKISSPIVNQLRNEYLGVLQQFRACLCILSDRCNKDPTKYQEITQLLVAIYRYE